MAKVNNAQPLASTHSLSKTHIPIALVFTPGELGKHGIPKEKLPKSIIVSERQIEEKSFKHFGLNDYEQIKARLKTEKNPFDAVRTSAKDGGAMLAYLDAKTGNYVVYLNIEKNLYRALTNKATELKTKIGKESRIAADAPKTAPFGNNSGGLNPADWQKRKLNQLLRDAEIMPSSFGIPSKLTDLTHIVVSLPPGASANADDALAAYIEKRYGNSNLFGQDKIDILNAAKQKGVKLENLKVSPNNARVVEFDLNLESLLRLQKAYLDVQYKVNSDITVSEKIKHEMALNQFLLGVFEGAKDDISANANAVLHPLETLQGIREAINILSQLSTEDLKAITTELGNRAANATPAEAAHGAGYIVGTAVVELILAKGAGAALSVLSKTKAGAELLARIGKSTEILTDIAKTGKAKVAEMFSDEAAVLASQRAKQKLASLIFYNGAAGAETLADLAIVAGNTLKNGAIKFGEFSAQMIRKCGNSVEPYLEKLYRENLIELGLSKEIDELGIAKSKLSKLTNEELKANLDTTVRKGETLVQAKKRIQQAVEERKLRGYISRTESLGENPPKVNIATNDAKYKITYNAHTDVRHSPKIALERNSVPAGTRTIEGRIYGDSPWSKAENFSYKWLDESTMHRTVHDYLEKNWEQIRWELAKKGEIELTFDAGKAIGEGYYNKGMNGIGLRQSVYSKTSYVKIVIAVDQTEPMKPVIITAHPLGKGQLR